MFKLIKYLKPFSVTIFVIILFLSIQAICDLSLPGYMSDIVNVGIQQGGIETAVPNAIRKSEFDKLTLFMPQKDLIKLTKSYTLLDKSSMSAADYARTVKKYPRLSEEAIYELCTINQKEKEDLDAIMKKPILIVSELERNEGFSTLSNVPKQSLPANFQDRLSALPDSIITQKAVLYLQKEYTALGIDTNKLQTHYILITGAIMLLIALVSMVTTVIVAYLGAKVAAGLAQSLRKNIFRKVTAFSNPEFDKFSTASLITRSTNDIQQIQMLMVMILRVVFYAPILGIGGAFKVLASNSSMGWTIAVAVMAILTLVAILFGIAIPKFKMIQKLIDRLNLITREILSGILVIRAFNTQRYEEKKFNTVNVDLTQTNLFVTRVMASMMPAMMLIMNGTTLLIVWVGAHQIDQGAMQVGDMMAFIQYGMQIIMAFLMLSMVSVMLPRATVSAQRIGEVLDSEISIKDADNLQNISADNKGFITFKNVSFRYPGAEENVLSNISFTARPGQTIAFIGSTGSGKTTLINLIERFYDVTEGEVLIDGVDVRKMSQHELREKIGFVPQRAVLFSGSIESNLKYGVNQATGDEITKAAQTAQAMEFIKEMPDGFSTHISQGGTNVSGGQKQRLSIARALVKKSPIYIFDDSFSALDFKTDATLRKALKEVTAQSTVLIIGQRINTIMGADQIIVLEEGKIVGMGTHKELMKNNEIYQQIALSQLSKEELEK